MTERDLENLSKVPVPPPRENAKKAALEAALKEFDTASLAAGSPHEESQLTTPEAQGNVRVLRQTETTQTKRSFRMSSLTRPQMAMAASVAALMIAAPMAFHQMSNRGLPNPGEFSGLTDTLEPRSKPATVREQTPAKTQSAPGAGLPDGRAVPATPPVDADRKDLAASGNVGADNARSDSLGAAGIAGGATSAPENAAPAPAATEKYSNAAMEERAAELEATTQRKGSRKAEVTVVPPANIPAEVAQGLGQAPASPPSIGGAVAGKQSLAADNAQLGTDFAGTLFPGNGVTFDGGSLHMDGAKKKSYDAPAAASLTPPPPPPAPAARLAKPAAPVATARLGDAEAKRERANPQGWMGSEADEKARPQFEPESRDKFDATEINPVKQVASEPVSTFSIDVDTASYAFMRRALNGGHLPPKEAVRVEELINYFPYNYPAPDSAETPFKPTVSVFNSPWNPRNKLVHVAIKGYDLKTAERPRANLVFLMDVSGSMGPSDRLPLVKNAFRMLLDQLQPDDTIGIVTYASGSGIALEPTRVADKSRILAAIDRLDAGGSTAGAAGIEDAYRLAEANFDKRAVNRIVLATDGDFNVGITDQNELKSYIERKRQSGIFLSILGVGQGNHNDALMQALAQNGNGTAAYADTLSEARKVLVDEASSTLFTIAKDVKVQIEWNPQRVSEYRLIGYETRNLKRQDFNNDRVDAGDIGSGHTVTAIYEVTPVGAPKMTDDLRYAAKPAVQPPADDTNVDAPAAQMSNELGFLKLRYKRPREDVSQLVSLPITDENRTIGEYGTSEVRFSTAVAAFGQLLKGEAYTQGFTFSDVEQLAQGARGEDPFGYRAEFLNLVRLAKVARP